MLEGLPEAIVHHCTLSSTNPFSSTITTAPEAGRLMETIQLENRKLAKCALTVRLFNGLLALKIGTTKIENLAFKMIGDKVSKEGPEKMLNGELICLRDQNVVCVSYCKAETADGY